jgi:hypothetical protein
MEQERRAQWSRAAAIRQGDHGSYTALRWVSTLFKSASVFLAVAMLAEFIAGIRAEGWSAMPILLGEVARATVLAVLLWAGGDLVRLLLQIGRDLRAERVLLARIAYRTVDPRVGAEEEALAESMPGDGVSAVDGAAPGGSGSVWGRLAAPDAAVDGSEPGEAAA